MSTSTLSTPGFSRERLFFASCLALLVTAMTFAVRADIMDALGLHFTLNKEQVGAVAGIAFLGFTASIFFGGQVVDALGMGRVLALAFVCHASGIVLTILAHGYWTLWTGTLLIGMGNGLIEAAVNPLVTTMYADRKTHRLNSLHAYFPGGIVVGGLMAYGLTSAASGLAGEDGDDRAAFDRLRAAVPGPDVSRDRARPIPRHDGRDVPRGPAPAVPGVAVLYAADGLHGTGDGAVDRVHLAERGRGQQHPGARADQRDHVRGPFVRRASSSTRSRRSACSSARPCFPCSGCSP